MAGISQKVLVEVYEEAELASLSQQAEVDPRVITALGRLGKLRLLLRKKYYEKIIAGILAGAACPGLRGKGPGYRRG